MLSRDLSALTEALDNPGTDLQAVLAVLADDLRAVVPSFTGLAMTVRVGGNPVTLVAVEPLGTHTAGASLQLPLEVFGAGPAGGTVVFYAANPGAFVDLGADSRRIFSLDGQVVIDGNLTSDLGHPGIRGLTEATALNRAIGILIEQGRSSRDARRRTASSRCRGRTLRPGRGRATARLGQPTHRTRSSSLIEQ